MKTPSMGPHQEASCGKKRVCVMEASGRVGSTIVRRLLQRGYTVHAALYGAPGEVQCFEDVSAGEKKRLSFFFRSDPLDYRTIVEALKACSGLFYCFEPPPDHPTYDELMAEMEVRAAHNVLEACAQTHTIEKVTFTSSATAVIWGDGLTTMPPAADRIDERNWSDLNFCKQYKLWHGMSKTLAEKTAWALAMDRGVSMVSINGGLLIEPPDDYDGGNMTVNDPYVKGAAEMYEGGVFVTVDLAYLVDAHICVFEEASSYGRYLCFNHVINSSTDALKLARMLLSSPSSMPPSHSLGEETRDYQQRISNQKLDKLMVNFKNR